MLTNAQAIQIAERLCLEVSMRFRSMVAVGLLSVIGCGATYAEGATVDAAFERNEPANASLEIFRYGDDWRVSIRAGGMPNGASTAADCELEAAGPQDEDGVIAARLIPFEGELNSVTAQDIGTYEVTISVFVGPEGAFVTDGGAAARFCGMGSDIDGFYRRIDMVE